MREYAMTDIRDNGRLRIPITWAVLISATGVAVGWGVNSQRMTDLERRTEQQATDTRQLTVAVTDQNIRIEVARSQYAEIIRRLDELDKKIDQGRQR